MNSEALTKLWKYKKQLDAFLKRNEDDKVLTMLQKINKLNITIEMIQETSIGKLVNSITSRKELGIGEKAAGLVNKWKRLIEEVVDKKYKSDDDNPPRQNLVETPIKKPQQSPKKTETPQKPLKRKSEAAEERQKPPKQSRTINKSVISTDSGDDSGKLEVDFPLSDENKKSFLDAISHKSKPKSSPFKPSEVKPVKPVDLQLNIAIEEDDNDDDDSSSSRSQRSDVNSFDYSDEVFEDMERVTTMLEERKKMQVPKVIEQDNIGGRTYAVPKVFCGKRVDIKKNIPTFVEKFQHLIYDNIENLEYIGNIPFEILEPVLRKLSPTQLERFEYFNPVVVQKSDDIWKMHVQLKYPSRKPAEFGSWREVYLDNRDAMKAKLEQSVQKFSTNVAKMKQEEHRTKFFDPCTARVGKRSSIKDASLRGGNSVGARGTAFSHKAPLMQKALKMVKRR